jgi:hypothetical protein
MKENGGEMAAKWRKPKCGVMAENRRQSAKIIGGGMAKMAAASAKIGG